MHSTQDMSFHYENSASNREYTLYYHLIHW